jgi:hypothetical protein
VDEGEEEEEESMRAQYLRHSTKRAASIMREREREVYY